jgi:hypothetical protein
MGGDEPRQFSDATCIASHKLQQVQLSGNRSRTAND